MIVQIDGEKFQEIIEELKAENTRFLEHDYENIALDQALDIFWRLAQTEERSKDEYDR